MGILLMLIFVLYDLSVVVLIIKNIYVRFNKWQHVLEEDKTNLDTTKFNSFCSLLTTPVFLHHLRVLCIRYSVGYQAQTKVVSYGCDQ